MNVAKIYGNAIRKKLNAVANWEPGTVRRVGDFGVMENGVFKCLGHLQGKINTPVITQTDDISQQAELLFNSNAKISAPFKVDGAVGPDGIELIKARISLEFTGNEAILFKMKPEKVERLLNGDAIAQDIESRHQMGFWQRDLVVVIEATTAASGLVAVSADKDTKLDLEAHVAALPELGLHHPALTFALASAANQSLQVQFASPATPLIKIAQLQRTSFLSPLRFRGGEPTEERYFYSLADLASVEMSLRENRLGGSEEERWVLAEFLPHIDNDA